MVRIDSTQKIVCFFGYFYKRFKINNAKKILSHLLIMRVNHMQCRKF